MYTVCGGAARAACAAKKRTRRDKNFLIGVALRRAAFYPDRFRAASKAAADSADTTSGNARVAEPGNAAIHTCPECGGPGLSSGIGLSVAHRVQRPEP